MTLSLFERCQSGLVSSLCCLSLRRFFSIIFYDESPEVEETVEVALDGDRVPGGLREVDPEEAFCAQRFVAVGHIDPAFAPGGDLREFPHVVRGFEIDPVGLPEGSFHLVFLLSVYVSFRATAIFYARFRPLSTVFRKFCLLHEITAPPPAVLGKVHIPSHPFSPPCGPARQKRESR